MTKSSSVIIYGCIFSFDVPNSNEYVVKRDAYWMRLRIQNALRENSR
ncbi:hypothetical protein NARC_40070 [Candidatus Nitrosocosmicus arcticus]|uniref:Uncharacterized protein n=1 Tax=Candidatus Nitrosocosmicus arcticus TaxID=2035267 RepID=A0A557SWX3_9ARCH|nr:hypothetical protein NARC_40070 [Candidatus Nitrosocosmicus arcticus]